MLGGAETHSLLLGLETIYLHDKGYHHSKLHPKPHVMHSLQCRARK
jgi:hypothetical protein